MVCCLSAPSHHLNQCWLITISVLRYSSEGNSIRSEETNHWGKFENFIFKITFRCPSDVVRMHAKLDMQLPSRYNTVNIIHQHSSQTTIDHSWERNMVCFMWGNVWRLCHDKTGLNHKVFKRGRKITSTMAKYKPQLLKRFYKFLYVAFH